MILLHFLTLGIGIAGIIIIIWGVILTLWSFVRLEYAHLGGADICRQRDTLRHHLGSYLLMGLEFLVAADIVNTIVKPTLNDLALLGSIVIIRTVLNYFLNREMAGTQYCKRTQEGQ